MPTPAIIASTRYIDPGVTRVYFIPSIASALLVPTRAELNAGTNLSPELSDWAGWTLSAELLDTQNITNQFKTTIPGSLIAPACTLTLYSSKNGIDVRVLLPAGTVGAIMFLDGGDTSGNKAEVWPIQVASTSVQRNSFGVASSASSASATASEILVQFAITGAPAQRVTVPA